MNNNKKKKKKRQNNQILQVLLYLYSYSCPGITKSAAASKTVDMEARITALEFLEVGVRVEWMKGSVGGWMDEGIGGWVDEGMSVWVDEGMGRWGDE